MITIPEKMIWGRIAKMFGWLVTAVLVIAAVGLLVAVAPVFGNKGLIVRSGSMVPAIGVGDLVVVRPSELGYKLGDVIAYRSKENSGIVVTHRIAEVRGGPRYVTKGDANENADEGSVATEQIIGRQILLVPYIGRALAFGKTKAGYVSFVLLPALLVIGGEIKVIWWETRKGKKGKLLKGQAADSLAEATSGLADYRRADGAVDNLSAEPTSIRRKGSLIPLDSAVARLAVFVGAMALMVPSTWSLYSDSEISSGNSFRAGCWTPPTIPVYVYPPDGMIAGPNSHWAAAPRMDWEDSAAPCGGTLQYQYQSAINSDFDPAIYTSGLLSASEIPAPGMPDGVYWWHVRSFNGSNYSEWSEAWMATVDRSLAQADHVVISEVQIAGEATNDDFIELYNPTDSSVDISGWKLFRKTSGGGVVPIKTINSGTMLAAHGFWLWANSGFTAVTPDTSTTDILSVDNSVRLETGIGTVIDAVAWGGGTSQFVEGAAFGANPGAGASIERKAVSDSDAAAMGSGGADETRGNGFDLDDNSFDFILRPVSDPQNSSSVKEEL